MGGIESRGGRYDAKLPDSPRRLPTTPPAILTLPIAVRIDAVAGELVVEGLARDLPPLDRVADASAGRLERLLDDRGFEPLDPLGEGDAGIGGRAAIAFTEEAEDRGEGEVAKLADISGPVMV